MDGLTEMFAVKGSAMACLGTALVWGVLPLVGWSRYSQDGIEIGCCPTLSDVPGVYSYTLSLTILEAVVPVIIITFCYCNIIKVVSMYGTSK